MENEIVESLNKISDSLIKLELSTKNISHLVDEIKSLNEACSSLSSTTKAFDVSKIEAYFKSFNTISSFAKNFNMNENPFKKMGEAITDMFTKFGKLTGIYTDVSTAAEGAAASTGLFGSAISLMTAHPIATAIVALGALVGVLALFSNSEIFAIDTTKEFCKAQEAKRAELAETAKAINENTTLAIESAQSAKIQSEVLKGYVESLKKLESEGNISGNLEQAKYYVEQINAAMPNTVSLTEDGRLCWLSNAEAIEKNIEALERKAKVEAYYDGYVESLKNESQLRAELTMAQSHYNAELKNLNDYQIEYNKLMDKYHEKGFLESKDIELLTMYSDNMIISREKLNEYSETLDTARGAYEANAKGAELYNQAVGALDGSVIASAKLQLEEYTVLEENGTSTWKSLAAASEDCKDRIETASEDEASVIQKTSLLVQSEMINKALTQKMTCDEMIKELESAGMTMNEEEKKQLEESYRLWEMNSQDIQNAQAKGLDTLQLMKSTALSNMNTTQKEKLVESVKLFAEKGNEEGLQLCQSLAEGLENNNGQVNEEMSKILLEIEKKAGNTNPTTNVSLDGPTQNDYARLNKEAEKGIKNQKIGVAMTPTQKGFSIFGHKITFDWWPFAEGGFPQTGQLFVAREAGPELVGRINGKTAVANNDQIVSGISSGVFNAVRSAMAGCGHNGQMNIHATFVMDGEVIGKQVIKYHNGVVKRTGTTPLMI